MGSCCSTRKGEISTDGMAMLYCKAQLSKSNDTLTRQHESLQKLNLHLSYFQQKSVDFSKLLKELRMETKERIDRNTVLSDSIPRMSTLVTTLDTEVEAQFLSERKSADLNKAELMTAIRTFRAQKQAEELKNQSERLSKYIAYQQQWEELEKKVEENLNGVKQTQTSLLGYIRYVATTKAEINTVIEDMSEVSSTRGGDKWESSLRKWTAMKDSTIILADDIDKFSRLLLSNFQKFDSDLEALRSDVKQFIDNKFQREKAIEVHSTAQPYLSLLSASEVALPRRSYRNSSYTTPPKTPSSPTPSQIADQYAGGMKWICTANHYKDGEPLSSEETFEEFLEMLHAKVEADHSTSSVPSSMMSLELFYLVFAAGKSTDSNRLVEKVTKFAEGLEKMEKTPLGSLAMKLLRLKDREFMSIHEESFITKAMVELWDLSQGDNWPTTTQEKWDIGGWMKFTTAIPVIEKWFSEEPEVGTNVMASLVPDFAVVDVTIHYILFKMMELRITAEDLYYELDVRSANNVLREEFVTGIKSQLKVLLPDSHLEAVSRILDNTVSNGIFRSEFVNLFHTHKYSSENIRLRVKILDAITSLRTVYKEWQSEMCSQLYLDFIAHGIKIEISNIEPLIKTIDSDLSARQLQQFIRKVKLTAGEVVGFDGFKEVALHYPIGKWGKSFFGKT